MTGKETTGVQWIVGGSAMKARRFESVGAAFICLMLSLSGRASACEGLHAGLSARVIHGGPRIVGIDAHRHHSWCTHHDGWLGHSRHEGLYVVEPRCLVKWRPQRLQAIGVWISDSSLRKVTKKHIRPARKARVHKYNIEKVIVVRAW